METIQDLHFELMRRASFGNFDGEMVVNILKEHRDLWKGAIMGRYDLLALRDISNDQWNVNTLFLTPAIGKEDELEGLAVMKLNADAEHWVGGPYEEAFLRWWNGKGRIKKRTVLACTWWGR
jgi:hypothetical protein